MSVTFALDGAVMADLIAALVVAVFLVKQQRVGAAFRNTDAVIVAVYRGEVADEEKILFLCFIAADKAENTAVSVVGVDPLEASYSSSRR